MDPRVEYVVGQDDAYSTTPVIYRVTLIGDAEVSRELARFEEIAANQNLASEYLASLKQYFSEKADDAFSVDDLNSFDASKLFILSDFISYMLNRTNSSRDYLKG